MLLPKAMRYKVSCTSKRLDARNVKGITIKGEKHQSDNFIIECQ